MPVFDEAFMERLRDIKQSHITYLVNSQVKDYAEYKKVCGFLEGLAVAESEFKELLAVVDE